MSSSDIFPCVSSFRLGYSPAEVGDFFEKARNAYEGGVPASEFSAEQVRLASFPLRRGGYDTKVVDAALNRLEAAFVQRDRADFIAVQGESEWYAKVADSATTLYPRLLKPAGERFPHPRKGEKGYRTDQVDALLDELSGFFDDKVKLTADNIRFALFDTAKGKKAYSEAHVDIFLGRAIDILLAVS